MYSHYSFDSGSSWLPFSTHNHAPTPIPASPCLRREPSITPPRCFSSTFCPLDSFTLSYCKSEVITISCCFFPLLASAMSSLKMFSSGELDEADTEASVRCVLKAVHRFEAADLHSLSAAALHALCEATHRHLSLKERAQWQRDAAEVFVHWISILPQCL